MSVLCVDEYGRDIRSHVLAPADRGGARGNLCTVGRTRCSSREMYTTTRLLTECVERDVAERRLLHEDSLRSGKLLVVVASKASGGPRERSHVYMTTGHVCTVYNDLGAVAFGR